MIEQPLFARESACISAELSTRIDDAMAGYDDGKLIGSVSSCDSAASLGASQGLRMYQA